MKRSDLAHVWQAVIARVAKEGYSQTDVLETMLTEAVAGLVEEHGFQDAASRVVTVVRACQPATPEVGSLAA